MVRLVQVMLLVAVVANSGTSPAQSPADTGDETDREYRRVIKRAVKEFQAFAFEEARALFRRAHRMRPSARTWRSLGVVEFELKHYRVAIDALTHALEDRRRPLSAEQHGHAEELLADAKDYVGRYRLKHGGGEIRVLVDGQPGQLDPDGTLLLDVGAHRLTVTKAGHADQQMVLDVIGGERATLRFTFSEDEAVAPATKPRVKREPTAKPTLDDEKSPAGADLPIVPVVVAGAGLGLMVGAIVTGAMAAGAESDLATVCTGQTLCDPAYRDLQDSANGRALASNVLWVSGGVAVATGVLLFLFWPEDEAPGLLVLPQVSPTTAGALLRGRL